MPQFPLPYSAAKTIFCLQCFLLPARTLPGKSFRKNSGTIRIEISRIYVTVRLKMLNIGAALEWMPRKCASVRGDSPKKEEESPLPFLAFLTAWQILTFFRRRKGTLVGGIFLTGGGGPISPPESPSPVKEFNGRNEGSFIFSSERPHTAKPLNPFWGWAPVPKREGEKTPFILPSSRQIEFQSKFIASCLVGRPSRFISRFIIARASGIAN